MSGADSAAFIMVFPAWAGVSPRRDICAWRGLCFPRVGGGEPALRQEAAGKAGFSPRGRG